MWHVFMVLALLCFVCAVGMGLLMTEYPEVSELISQNKKYLTSSILVIVCAIVLGLFFLFVAQETCFK